MGRARPRHIALVLTDFLADRKPATYIFGSVSAERRGAEVEPPEVVA